MLQSRKSEAEGPQHDRAVLLPLQIVHGIHKWGKKKGYCQQQRGDINSAQIRCQCHKNQLKEYPTVAITSTDANGREKERDLLLPEDYLGEPYLDNYNVYCDSLLQPILASGSAGVSSAAEEEEERIGVSLPDDIREKTQA